MNTPCKKPFTPGARRSRSAGQVLLLVLIAPMAMGAEPCDKLRGLRIAGQNVTIDSARNLAATTGTQGTLPAQCRVEGAIDSRVGRDGKPYAIGFALALPEKWNGRFLFQGGGGLNGSVQPPLGAQYSGGQSALARGFAVASTDSGHRGAVFDGSFLRDQEATLNFLYQGVAKVTVVAREILTRHYGRKPNYSYFVGCSTGGREAMMMSQRFPDYFNGIVAGAPAMRTSFSNLGLRHATAALNAIAPKKADGMPDTRNALSDNDRRLLVDSVLAACDELDGNRDGFLFAPQRCGFDPGTLACRGPKADGCLSEGQVAAVRAVMAGPKTGSGRQVYPGYFYDTGIATTQGLPGILAGPVIPEGPVIGASIDVDAEWARAVNARSMVGDTDAWTNLSSFRQHAGKLIFLHGVSDPWFSAKDTVEYYQRLAQDNTEAPLAQWSRLFLVPGMGHCGGGERTLDRVDLLSAITEWVEHDRAPERIVATGASAPGESRPLCPYPGYAKYRGTEDARDAGSYDCQVE